MKILLSISLFMLVMAGCETASPIDDSNEFDLKQLRESWIHSHTRYPSSEEVFSVEAGINLQLTIEGKHVKMIHDGKIFQGIYQQDYFLFSEDYYLSPQWKIIEKTEGELAIYPRMGAMYAFEFIFTKLNL